MSGVRSYHFSDEENNILINIENTKMALQVIQSETKAKLLPLDQEIESCSKRIAEFEEQKAKLSHKISQGVSQLEQQETKLRELQEYPGHVIWDQVADIKNLLSQDKTNIAALETQRTNIDSEIIKNNEQIKLLSTQRADIGHNSDLKRAEAQLQELEKRLISIQEKNYFFPKVVGH